jgi:hypothetical protein
MLVLFDCDIRRISAGEWLFSTIAGSLSNRFLSSSSSSIARPFLGHQAGARQQCNFTGHMIAEA